jgi:hypothetical protein
MLTWLILPPVPLVLLPQLLRLVTVSLAQAEVVRYPVSPASTKISPITSAGCAMAKARAMWPP